MELAVRVVVPKGVVVLDPRGEEYSAENIGERLSVRNFMDGLRTTGVETGGHAAYGPREKQAFANARFGGQSLVFAAEHLAHSGVAIPILP